MHCYNLNFSSWITETERTEWRNEQGGAKLTEWMNEQCEDELTVQMNRLFLKHFQKVWHTYGSFKI